MPAFNDLFCLQKKIRLTLGEAAGRDESQAIALSEENENAEEELLRQAIALSLEAWK